MRVLCCRRRDSDAAFHLIPTGLVLAAFASIAGTGFAYAQSPTVPDAAPPVTAAARPPPASVPATSSWDAPEPWRTDRFYLETSLWTTHFDSDPNHDDHQNLILFEWNVTENWLIGGAVFDNSFGQSSQLVYGGYRFRPFEKLQQLYFKVAAGIVHGYSGEYQNKIPFNGSGFAPVIVPSMGYCFNRFCSELVIFGTAGAMVTFGVTIP
jgi:hypothetical protein